MPPETGPSYVPPEHSPELGRFELTDEEKQRIIKKAARFGQPPEEALQKAQVQFEQANANLQDRERRRTVRTIEEQNEEEAA